MKNISKSHPLLKGKDGVSFSLYEETVVYVLDYNKVTSNLCCQEFNPDLTLIPICISSPSFNSLRITPFSD